MIYTFTKYRSSLFFFSDKKCPIFLDSAFSNTMESDFDLLSPSIKWKLLDYYPWNWIQNLISSDVCNALNYFVLGLTFNGWQPNYI